MPNKPISAIEQVNLGGLSDSKFSGVKYSVYKLLGIDLHTTPGILQARQALAKVSATTVTGLCKVRVSCSDGNSYWFDSQSGKVWKVTAAGTTTLVHTTTPDKGDAYCLGAAEYYGYIYWATQKRLHRIPISGLSDWSTNASEDWAQLNLDQELIATGQTYTLTTGVNEGATHIQQFVPAKNPCEAVALNVGAKGTGNWTVLVHNSANSVVGTVTVTNANMATGWYIFTFSSSFTPVLGDTYHIHAYSTVADGTVVTGTTVDFETAAFRTYTDSDADFHPMKVQNLILFIGDQNMIHQVEDNTFTKDALDIKEPLRIKCLGTYMTDILLGTYVSDNVNQTEVYRWNTFSGSFTNSDPIPEMGINAFFESDNFVFVSAGLYGNIYVYNGEVLDLYKKVPGDYSPTKEATIHPNAVGNLGNLILFGVSNSTGNPCEQGVYVIGRHNRNYPFVMDLSFPISERSGGAFVTSSIEIGAILVMGYDVFVSWKNGSTYGIDKLDYSTKLSGAYIESRVQTVEREMLQTFAKIVVPYASLPASTSVAIGYDVNYTGSYTTTTDNKDDTGRKIISAEDSPEGTVIQIKLTLTTSSNNSPQIESAAIIPS